MNDGPRSPELFHHVLDEAERVPGRGGLALPVLDHVRGGRHRPRAHPAAALPPRRALRPPGAVRAPADRVGRRVAADPARARPLRPGQHRPGPDRGGRRGRARSPTATTPRASAAARPGRPARSSSTAGAARGPRGGRACSTPSPTPSARRTSTSPSSPSASGEVHAPPDLPGRVIDLGFIDDATRDDAMAAATAYLQPSALESFSRTVMEAWLAGTPVIANGGGRGGRAGTSSAPAPGSSTTTTPSWSRPCASWPRRPTRPPPWPARAATTCWRLLHLAGHAGPHGGHPRRVVPAMSTRPPRPRRERVLVVSPYPPIRDGIGAYALQQVRSLRRQGHHVEVLSPVPSAAHHHADLRGPAGAAALARIGAPVRPGRPPPAPRRHLPPPPHRRGPARHRAGLRRRLPAPGPRRAPGPRDRPPLGRPLRPHLAGHPVHAERAPTCSPCTPTSSAGTSSTASGSRRAGSRWSTTARTSPPGPPPTGPGPGPAWASRPTSTCSSASASSSPTRASTGPPGPSTASAAGQRPPRHRRIGPGRRPGHPRPRGRAARPSPPTSPASTSTSAS